jgi:hypothetical protein
VRRALDAAPSIPLREKEVSCGADLASPMHMAVLAGRADLAEWLLAEGADPLDDDRTGESALHEAARRGNLSLTKMMIERDRHMRNDKGHLREEVLRRLIREDKVSPDVTRLFLSLGIKWEHTSFARVNERGVKPEHLQVIHEVSIAFPRKPFYAAPCLFGAHHLRLTTIAYPQGSRCTAPTTATICFPTPPLIPSFCMQHRDHAR